MHSCSLLLISSIVSVWDQSKSHHSTETALLRMFNDFLLTADSGSSAVLVLSLFYTVEHQILLSHLELCVGIKGFCSYSKYGQSYLAGKTFSVHLAQYSSATAPPSAGSQKVSFWVLFFSFPCICCLWDRSLKK